MKMRNWLLQALQAICLEHAYSNLYLQQHLQEVEKKDQALATAILYGTLQHARYVRYQWSAYVKRLPSEPIALLLDFSVYQLLFLDQVPAYAIIHEAVELCAGLEPKAKGMVNAVLRRVQREGARSLPADPWQALAIETGHPDWLVAMWRSQYGDAVCEKLCRSALRERFACVRVNVMRADKEELLRDERFRPGRLSKDALLYSGGSIAKTKAYQEGLISIQDEASQMVCLWLDPKPREQILDVCSAPGSKACHIAEHMHDQGRVVCGDIHAHRVELIRQGAKRLQLSCIDARVMDASDLSQVEDASFDGVLCDVPCSGFGVMGRKSDLKYHLDSTAMDTLIPLQRAILEAAARKVKPLGRLVYSTCTLNKKENEKQVAAFLQRHPAFTLEAQRTYFPFEYDCDGFFIALLRKTAEA